MPGITFRLTCGNERDSTAGKPRDYSDGVDVQSSVDYETIAPETVATTAESD